MMREIKFRAWSETRREMREVSIVSFGPPITAYSHDNWMAMGDNLVLTQFTGLRDKDGKEIYEGDIDEDEYFGRIYWHWLLAERQNWELPHA